MAVVAAVAVVVVVVAVLVVLVVYSSLYLSTNAFIMSKVNKVPSYIFWVII